MPRQRPPYDPEALRDSIRRMEDNIQAFLNKVQTLQKQKTGHRENIRRIEDNISGLLEGVEKLRKEKHNLEALLNKVEREAQ